MSKRKSRIVLNVYAGAKFLSSLLRSVELKKPSVCRLNSLAVPPGIRKFISIAAILCGTVFSHPVYAACFDPPPGAESTTSNASGYVPGVVGQAFIIKGFGGNPWWNTGPSIAILSMSDGGSFEFIVGPCQPQREEYLGLYTKATANAEWAATYEKSYGAGIGITLVWLLASPKNLGRAECPPSTLPLCVGNPINVATGNKLQVETDVVGGPNTHLELRRYYNSLAINATPFGMHWRGTYDRSVVTQGSTVAQVWREDGRVDTFRLVSGSWVADPDVAIALSEVTSGGVQIGWQVERPDLSTENYDMDGKLISIVTRAGLTTTLTYNVSDQLTTVTGAFGHALSFTYTANGNVDQITTPENQVYTYAYDLNNNLVSVTYPDTEIRQYTYTNASFPHALTGIIDELGNSYASFGYDSQGLATSSQHAQTDNGVPQKKFTIAYGFGGQRTVTDPAGNAWVYQLQTQHGTMRPTRITSQVDGKSVSQVLDASNNVTSRTDEEGRTTTFTYNANNQRVSMTEASGTAEARTTSYEYLSPTEDLVTKVISPSVSGGSNRETITTYDANRNVTQITIQGFDPSGAPVARTTTMQYNADGLVTQINGPRTDVSDITTLQYYECTTGAACGQLQSITNAVGHLTTYDTYDAHGRVTQMTDPNSVVIAYAYDVRGKVLSVTETPPAGTARTTTYTYDGIGQVKTVTAPNGTILTYTYDAAHDLKSITDNLGNEIRYRYDLKGNRTDEDVYDPLDTLVRTADYVYDLRNRIDLINAAGSITDTVYNAVGDLTSETDPNNNATSHGYDPLSRISQTIDALTGTTDYDYDVNDYLVAVVAANGATTTYAYDDLGNLLSVSSPDTGTTAYTYDAAGNRLTQTDANSVTATYTYDALNRLTSISYPDTVLNVTLVYDDGINQKGRLTSMADGSGSALFSYDGFGNLTEDRKIIDGNTHVTNYAYDTADLLIQIAYPSGRTVDYTRNLLGQVTQVDSAYDAANQTVASNIAYKPFGPLSGLTFGNGLVLGRTYDQQYRSTDLTAGAIQDLDFTLDAAGNIDGITDWVNPSLNQTFTQDALHRIDHEAGSYGTKDYTYDGVGNRLSRSHNNGGITLQTLTYATSSNRLATHDGNTVTLDAAGNTTADPTQNFSFVYADHNRMVEAYVGAVLQATYAYNGQGQRVKKIEATGLQRTFVFHYGLNGELIGETVYDNLGAKIEERDYIWLDTLPLAQAERAFSGGSVTSSSFVYIHADQLNTPRLASDASQTIVWRWDSDGFGVGEADADPDFDTNLVNIRLRFPGQYFDEETGLHYNYFRDYDPVTARYVQSDPIGLGGGINTYAYVVANPLRYTDPSGLGPWGAGLAATACGLALGVPTLLEFSSDLENYLRERQEDSCGQEDDDVLADLESLERLTAEQGRKFAFGIGVTGAATMVCWVLGFVFLPF